MWEQMAMDGVKRRGMQKVRGHQLSKQDRHWHRIGCGIGNGFAAAMSAIR